MVPFRSCAIIVTRKIGSFNFIFIDNKQQKSIYTTINSTLLTVAGQYSRVKAYTYTNKGDVSYFRSEV